MPAPGPVLIQYIMSKLLLAAAPIETLIKAIRGSSWGGAGGWEDVVNSGYVGTDVRERARWIYGGTWWGILCGHRWRCAHSTGLKLSFPPLCIASSLHLIPCLPLGALVHPQRWLFRSGLAWLRVIYSSAAVWGHCGAQLLHISMGG